ncbi:class I SAM-dependent methyltransferase [Bacillus atrophaeus]|uniref:class I SAM-dependent methyltransferase n=1 Tax=Bacillus atrophaeus TaxID=1452 RepID=UPI00227E607F|nr:class I SAM-dependent methyltransferase [Bacillus atrophaeus]MCY8823365.1 class I SAM-dependent methyltransferase [Bacillus atrophaeus]MCY8841542.1 class I SAM-dependent methyltransferase [Bacillus atrophaeus]MEC0805798.1 class I SAM-dependent methyltransferase [Bacillus atrophaeus]MEC0853713.1 class I SAM-dependent methyltransferase [Bacillus atrophaeus]MEC0856840.1 class I SAM-dependent methyltransferase [Bacillus atrophaeus]
MKIKNKILIGILGLFIVLGIIFYQPAMNYFLRQAANPDGLIGYAMTKIWNKTFDNMTDWGLNSVDIQENNYILDVGCGGGETIYKIANQTRQGKVFGIDNSAEAVKSSLERNQKWIEQNRVEIVKADVASLPYENETFDKITAVQTHIYWEDIEKGFSEIYRVLKAGGTLLIICEKDKIDYHMDKYKESNELINLFKSIGFSNAEVREYANWIEFIVEK